MSRSLDLLRVAVTITVAVGGGSAHAADVLAAARAPAAPAAPAADQVLSPQRTDPGTWGVTAGLGLRSNLVHSGGLDPFSGSDEIAQRGLSVSYRLAGTELSGLGAGLEWDHGSTTATARGANASLAFDRLTIPIEGRFRLGQRLALLARVAPGFVRDHAILVDASAPGGVPGDGLTATELRQTSWLFAADVSGGLAFRFVEIRNIGIGVLGFWLTAEAGYGYVQAHDLVLAARAESQPGRVDEPLRLGALALGGPFLRARLMLSF